MAQFSKRSRRQLESCHEDLQKVMNEVIKYYDITILEGHRNQADQDLAYKKGLSRVHWPNGRHNKTPSLAVDVAPWIPGKGIDWNNTAMFHYMAGRILATAEQLGIKLRWGGDWNRNQYSGDEKFLDLVHFELDE